MNRVQINHGCFNAVHIFHTKGTANIEIERNHDAEVRLIYQAPKRYQEAIARGLLRRLREGRDQPAL